MHTETKFSSYVKCEHTNKTKILLYVAISKLNAKTFFSVSLAVCCLLRPDFVCCVACVCVCVQLVLFFRLFWLAMLHFHSEISKNNIYYISMYITFQYLLLLTFFLRFAEVAKCASNSSLY